MSEPTRSDSTEGRGGDLAAWIEALGSESRSEREAARKALAEAGAEAVAPLVECLRDKRVRVRWEAAKTLVEVAEPEAAPALVEALEDEDSGVRWLAAEALIALERDGLAALLLALEVRADSNRLREGAHHVIRGLPVWKLVKLLTPVVDALEHTGAESTVPVAAGSALDTLKREIPPCRRGASRTAS